MQPYTPPKWLCIPISPQEHEFLNKVLYPEDKRISGRIIGDLIVQHIHVYLNFGSNMYPVHMLTQFMLEQHRHFTTRPKEFSYEEYQAFIETIGLTTNWHLELSKHCVRIVEQWYAHLSANFGSINGIPISFFTKELFFRAILMQAMAHVDGYPLKSTGNIWSEYIAVLLKVKK